MAEEGAINIFRSPSVNGFGFVAKHGSEGAETPTESHRRARRFFVARRQLLTRELAKDPKKPRPPTPGVSPGSGRPERPARRPASLSAVERTSPPSIDAERRPYRDTRGDGRADTRGDGRADNRGDRNEESPEQQSRR
jgi:hypothetical protein|tara:strand:- start:655 stop:1068 length:414 start_codon:yes stop_codon:yes gene_type:complete